MFSLSSEIHVTAVVFLLKSIFNFHPQGVETLLPSHRWNHFKASQTQNKTTESTATQAAQWGC